MSFTHLFKPLEVGSLKLRNRFIMSPLTRCRATMPGHLPNDLMKEYYQQRASAGLIIAEATMVNDESGFHSEPGCYTTEQAHAWKAIVDAVHSKGGLMAIQLVHPGRAAHSSNNGGRQPVAPSAIGVEGHKINALHNGTGQDVPYEVPRALTTEEIPHVIEMFVNAAKLAMVAGFDAVELHAANGYLLDEFLRSSANQRTDKYGGSIENQCRLLLEVVDAVSKAVGKDKVGVRISTLNSYNGMKDEDPLGLTKYLATKLSEAGIAFMDVMRYDFFGVQHGDVVTVCRDHFKGAVLVNIGLTPEEAEGAIEKGAFDGAVFGTKFLANPDLPHRVKAGIPLNNPDPSTFYTQGAKGYTDYPAASA